MRCAVLRLLARCHPCAWSWASQVTGDRARGEGRCVGPELHSVMSELDMEVGTEVDVRCPSGCIPFKIRSLRSQLLQMW